MLTSYLQSLQLNVDKFSTCTYKLQTGYNIIIIIIVLVFTTQVTKFPSKGSHSHHKIKKEKCPSQPLAALRRQRLGEHGCDGRQTRRHEATTEQDVCGGMTRWHTKRETVLIQRHTRGRVMEINWPGGAGGAELFEALARGSRDQL